MKVNPYGVRTARPADAEKLGEFVCAHFTEEGVQPVSPAKVGELVERCVNREQAIAGIVDMPDGIAASIGAVVETFDYSDNPHIQVKWLRVDPSCRHTNLATELLRYARWMHDALVKIAARPMPMFLPILTTTSLYQKVISFERQAPLVSASFGFGCLPGRQFLRLSQMGAGRGSRWGSHRSLPSSGPAADPSRRTA